MKKAKIVWDKESGTWNLFFKSGDEWLLDSGYFVKDVDPKSGIGWVSETLLTRARYLNNLGYKVTIE